MPLKTTKGCCNSPDRGCCTPEICWTVELEFEYLTNDAVTFGTATVTVTLHPVEPGEILVSDAPCDYYGTAAIHPEDAHSPYGDTWFKWTVYMQLNPQGGVTGLAQINQLEGPPFCRWFYSIEPEHYLGTPCTTTLIGTRIDALSAGTGLCDLPASEVDFVGRHGFDRLVPSGLGSPYSTAQETLFFVPAPNCPEVVTLNCPLCIEFHFTGVTNGTCTDCDDFNLIHVGTPETTTTFFVTRATSSCAYLGTLFDTDVCVSASGGASAQWVLVYNNSTTTWTLSFVVYDSGGTAIGTLVNYSLVDATSLFPKTLSLDSGTGCNWPADVEIRACSGDPHFGACCQTVSSVGIQVCGEDRESNCDDLGGTFLGVGTDCYREGCSDCHFPEDCRLYSNQYRIVATGVTGTCAAQINGSVVLIGGGSVGGGCEWTGSNAAWSSIVLTVDGATTPPTWNVLGTGVDGSIGTFSGQAYCDAETVLLTFGSFVPGTFCGGTDFTNATVYLEVT